MTETPTSPRRTSPIPELLAPAGDWECVRAAVENGADAIYFGLDRFNARMRARNFTEADLPDLMAFLHQRGVRGYVTVNTLVFENELAEAERYLRAVIAAGVDAAIVQDVGVCRLIRQISPDFPIHASTQMTITSAAGVDFARSIGCDLVVLARECSLAEIGRIQSATPDGGLPLEVFVHGALCVAYSGQCLTSESLGGRSANRGECAQACRMPYDLISDGAQVPLGDRRYLLSPQDLAGVDVLPELAALGVVSLKIEGRLKAPEYVANITQVYRRALDRLGATSEPPPDIVAPPAPSRDVAASPAPPSGVAAPPSGVAAPPEAASPALPRGAATPPDAVAAACEAGGSTLQDPSRTKESSAPLAGVDEQSRYSIEMAFSRGIYTGWFRGIDNQELVHARFGKKRGVYLGEVADVLRDSVIVDLETPLKLGDGVVFDAGHPDEKEEGGRIYEIRSVEAHGLTEESPARATSPSRAGTSLRMSAGGRAVRLLFARDHIDFDRIRVGDKVWKTSDPELEKRWRQSFSGESPRFTRPVSVEVHGAVGTALFLIARDELGHVAQAGSGMDLVAAENRPMTTTRLRDQLGRLGGTPFHLGELANRIEGDVMLPVSELNRLRREVVEALLQQRSLPKRWRMTEVDLVAQTRPDSAPRTRPDPVAGARPHPDDGPANLIVLVRSLAQLEAALRSGVTTIYCEFENPKKYREAVPMARRASLGVSIFVAPPRIFKPGEEWTLQQVRSCEADGYLVRNYDHLRFFAGDRRVGDFSLNVANRISAEYFLREFGLERVTASYDLDFQQLEALLQCGPAPAIEVTIHQHMPMFHMEHCVFCAFLSTGKDYRDCGRPCDVHDVRLRDRVGAEHPLKADAGCRNTVFNSQAQSGAEYVERMQTLGVRHFRIEFLNETPDEVATTTQRYSQLLRGEIRGTELWRELKLLHQLGVTRGQMAGIEV